MKLVFHKLKGKSQKRRKERRERMFEPDSKRAKVVLQNVTDQLVRSQTLLKEWIERQQAVMNELQASAEEVSQAQGKEIARLRGEIIEAKANLESEREENARKKGQVAALTKEVDEIKAKCEKIRADNKEKEPELARRLQERKERYEAAQARKAALDARLAVAQKMLRLYQESLGLTLDIVVNPQNFEVLLIGFKYVDARDPERLFGFGIYIKDDVYEVENCLPSEPPNMKEMLEELNTSGNLGGFLAGMRKYFKSLTVKS